MQPYKILATRDNKKLSLELTNAIPDDICVDWTLYSEILFHLVQNALKFTQKGGKLTLRVSHYPINLHTNHYVKNLKD